MKRFLTGFLALVFLANLQAFSQTFCEETKIRVSVGKTEKFVYKHYSSEKGTEKDLHFILVHPSAADGLPIKKQPLIIGVHSGGFINFCPFEPCYVKYSENVLTENFTARGFLTASIEYRLAAPLDLNPPNINDEKLKEVQYKAIQDVRGALKYIFENADKLGVDTENVFLFGTSAGAITVLNAAFLDNEEAPKDLVRQFGQLEKREKIKGVISLSGAIYDLSYLAGGDKVPLMIVHGTADSIVPIDKGFYLKMKHLTPVYGGRAVFGEAQKLGIPAKGFFYDFGHGLPDRFSSDVFKNANDFIRSNLTCVKETKTITAAAAR